MIVKLLTEHNLEFLSLKGGCRCSSESTLVKMSNCWKSHSVAQLYQGLPFNSGRCFQKTGPIVLCMITYLGSCDVEFSKLGL